MHDGNKPVRVLYSFPLRMGAGRVCTTAWEQVNGAAAAGAEMIVFPAAISRPLPARVKVRPTLARGKFRVPNKLLGRMHYTSLHDWIVARRLEKMAGQIDIVHAWPLGSRRTLATAARLGIPTVLERCNAHTRFAYEVVRQECERLGVTLPPDHEHAYNTEVLRREEAEYELASQIVCPSDFVRRTFVDRGFPPAKLRRHQYGYDENVFRPGQQNASDGRGLTMLFAGGCAPRKGLHYALEAWLQSPASRRGTFFIAGEFLPAYKEKLSAMLAHPSVRVLGHREDLPELMGRSDVFVLPTIEEGSALVTSEARGSGCVLLVSEAAGAVCRHMENALVHSVGDTNTLAAHITALHEDRQLLRRLRTASLESVSEITWAAAGRRLLAVYNEIVSEVGCPKEPQTAGTK
ncbi:MAG TPA: glycosyltransferase family 4 protein [Verrucomicrobiae bacterium]|nr:glycosyltransferase family 4 protein [Verrucomicrobiae bacterium]